MVNRLIGLAKSLRKRATDTEQVLWQHLRAKNFGGLKFKRQQPIGPYIVDFVCFEKKTIIELDGSQQVLTNIQGVLEVIGANCLNHPPLNPLPSREGK